MGFKLNAQKAVALVKTGARVAVPAGAGFLFGRIGVEAAKAASPRLATWIGTSKVREGLVRLLVGVPLGLALAFILARKNVVQFTKVAALAIGGTVVAAAEPIARENVEKVRAKVVAWFTPRNGAAPAALPPGSPPPVAGYLPVGGAANPYADMGAANQQRRQNA